MKTLYLECNMGAAGDMLMASLLELHPDPLGFIQRINSVGIPEVTVTAEKMKKCGITGTHIRVSVDGREEDEHLHDHHHEHQHGHHSHISDIENIISQLNTTDSVKKNASSVYRLIAEAESRAHDTEIENIHFHEVGTMDAVADIVGVCMLMDEIAPYKVICSPVNTGGGTVKCAHGILPVPAPATAYLLRGIPIYGGEIKSELCTPTGAALIRHFASEFGVMPAMRVSKTGYGMGRKDFETANCVRAFLGETDDKTDEVCELRCNIDDMTGEQMGFAVEMLMDGGALDVFTSPVGMKKSRPGILLDCLCKTEDKKKIIELIFKHTTTIGIREYAVNRYVLKREIITLNTPYGDVRAKRSSGYGAEKIKAEYDDLAKIAKENNISVSDIRLSGN